MRETPLPSFDLTRNWERVRDETLAAINVVLDSQHFILGPEVEALEKDLAAYLGTAHTVGCASGTDALLLALMALDLGPGDEVITTPFSFFATASCVTRLGATPIFADVMPDSYNIDPKEVLRKISPRTKAVIPVVPAPIASTATAPDSSRSTRPVGGSSSRTYAVARAHRSVDVRRGLPGVERRDPRDRPEGRACVRRHRDRVP